MSAMDPDNPVNALCIRGMAAEGQGDIDEARRLFGEAWDLHSTDLEGAVAAHYVARHQDDPQLTLHWNQVALTRALACDPEVMAPLLPSLHLNLGKSFEDSGQRELARNHYEEALAASHVLGDDPYGRMLLGGIEAGLARTD